MALWVKVPGDEEEQTYFWNPGTQETRGDVPDGVDVAWIAQKGSGGTYYWNKYTRETTWNPAFDAVFAAAGWTGGELEAELPKRPKTRVPRRSAAAKHSPTTFASGRAMSRPWPKQPPTPQPKAPAPPAPSLHAGRTFGGSTFAPPSMGGTPLQTPASPLAGMPARPRTRVPPREPVARRTRAMLSDQGPQPEAAAAHARRVRSLSSAPGLDQTPAAMLVPHIRAAVLKVRSSAAAAPMEIGMGLARASSSLAKHARRPQSLMNEYAAMSSLIDFVAPVQKPPRHVSAKSDLDLKSLAPAIHSAVGRLAASFLMDELPLMDAGVTTVAAVRLGNVWQREQARPELRLIGEFPTKTKREAKEEEEQEAQAERALLELVEYGEAAPEEDAKLIGAAASPYPFYHLMASRLAAPEGLFTAARA